MNLTVTVRMNQYQIGHRASAAIHSPDNVVNVPPTLLRDSLDTHRATSPLIEPETNELLSTGKGMKHLQTHAFFEVALPNRIESIRFGLNLRVSTNRRVRQAEQQIPFGLTIWELLAGVRNKGPFAVAHPSKVTLHDPVLTF